MSRPRRSWLDEVDDAEEKRGLEKGELHNREEWKTWLRGRRL